MYGRQELVEIFVFDILVCLHLESESGLSPKCKSLLLPGKLPVVRDTGGC